MDLDFYASPSRFTTVARHAKLLTGLPADPRDLRAITAELIMHIGWSGSYDATPPVPAGVEREAELNTRPADGILDIVLSRSADIVGERRPEQRMTGVCRHFAVLYCALLRARHIPARVRCGFAAYFRGSTPDNGFWDDHWITEYRSGRRWVRTDAQLDRVQLGQVAIDPDDVPEADFWTAAQAWRAYRAGRVDPARFGIDGASGVWFIAASVVRDLAALNKVEMLPWDFWAAMRDWRLRDEAVDLDLVDRLASIAYADPVAVRAAWAALPQLWLPADLSLVHSVREP
ncbi:transglutaminase domain-containing protein [Plantactinospora solaniradicis]|uniref:Transglutaminase domain-containing protein n=1 Tax=Plantactinospora solaniradicis TaxID=1723736 RepID=A0ABW1KEU2_9ACTN